jgi:hypothetical protein
MRQSGGMSGLADELPRSIVRGCYEGRGGLDKFDCKGARIILLMLFFYYPGAGDLLV